MASDRIASAALLSDQLLEDIEMSRIGAADQIRRASRLARLLDDDEALAWLGHEIEGFTTTNGGLTDSQVQAATRSRRQAPSKESGKLSFWTDSVDKIQAEIESARLQLAASADAPVSVSSANPSQFVSAPSGNARERASLREFISHRSDLLGRIQGAVHKYASEKNVELRFGAAMESAFAVLRRDVDSKIASLVPAAGAKFATAFENAASRNSEDWANAAGACRRLIKAVADELRPAGEPVNNIKMTDDKYINRLIDWINEQHELSATPKDVIRRDLEFLGNRLDAFADAGHKGAHAEVSRYEASRYITGTYLLIGDILRLNDPMATSADAASA
ncbi:AbiTii domain-containing protein [Arthrobacter sp. Hor0625]|uniref:AbiTii domain-containing protein n=1 Tax=Arthrobacter sp. Hor0625 TaxID=3457358 RepID=UPI00403EBEB1